MLVQSADVREAVAHRQRLRPRAPAADRRRARGARPARAHRRVPVRGRGGGHRVRGLRRRLQPRPAHGGRRALRLRALAATLPPADGGGAARRGGGEAVRKLAAAGAPIARAEGFEWHARSMEARAVTHRRARPPRPRCHRSARSGRTRHQQHDDGLAPPPIERRTGETDVRLTLALDGTGKGTRATGVGFLDHMLDLLARHGRLDLDVQVERRPADRRPPHRGGHRDRARPGARPGARRPRRDRPLRLGAGADGRGARQLRDRHLRAPVHALRGRPAARLHRGLRARADRGVLPRGGQRRRSSRCTCAWRPAPTPTT